MDEEQTDLMNQVLCDDLERVSSAQACSIGSSETREMEAITITVTTAEMKILVDVILHESIESTIRRVLGIPGHRQIRVLLGGIPVGMPDCTFAGR